MFDLDHPYDAARLQLRSQEKKIPLSAMFFLPGGTGIELAYQLDQRASKLYKQGMRGVCRDGTILP